MPHIIGIDLGTTNTAVAVLENGRPRVIEDDRGYKILPSVLSAKEEGRFVVGQAAHNLILTRPDRTVYAVKRLIGRRFDSPEVQRVIKRVGYLIREAPDGGVQVQVGDSWMTPSEVAAVILQVARGIAEKALGEPVEEAVITVPAHFNHAQRKATLEAAEIAGLRCDRIINEPTAAALAYGHRRNVDRTIVVFDLGGGTFDVSVLRLSGGLYEILATNGDTFLGGEDFDFRIVDYLADQMRTRTGIDIREDREALQRVKDAAERAKCELSFSDRTTVIVPHVAPGHNLEMVVTRTRLEDLCRGLVEKCVEVARDAVAEAGLSMSDIEDVILVGGQTRMPLVREAVAGLFGREPSRSVHPEEAVAIGAAVHAAALGDVEGTPAVLLDVTPFDVGIDAAGGMFSRIVQKNARIPCSESRTFATVHDGQESVRITVRQGESRVAEENEFLGEFMFEGLRPAPRMETKVGVTFRIDANGMLHVTAVEPSTGEKRNIGIRSYADRTRSIVRPAAAGGGSELAVPVAAPSVATPGEKKKVGFFEQLFGGGGKKQARPSAPRAAAAAAEGPTSPDLVPIHPLALVPPPVIVPLPAAPLDPSDEYDALPSDALRAVEALEELDEVDPYEMPDDFDAMEADLYKPSSASANFGLAGAHQVGAEGGGGDPFADLGAPRASSVPPQPAAPPPERAPALATWEIPDNESLDPNDLFGGADANTMFEDPFGEDEQDPPTDPGLSFPTVGRPAAPKPDPLSQSEENEFSFSLTDSFEDDLPAVQPNPAPTPQPSPPSPLVRRLPDDATPQIHRPALDDDESGFSVPMLDADTGEAAAEPSVLSKKAARKPARVRLHYRERALLVAEYTENLRRGGAVIRTERPLASGRECVFEINGPGLPQPLVIPASVSRVLADGMEVEYHLDDVERSALLALLGA